jgi:1-deoxy-D-xylulose-5-phosphate reductoisomerase
LAQQAAEVSGTAPAILNAANEIAVAAFLNRSIRFDQIALVIDHVLSHLSSCDPLNLAQIQSADAEARALAQQLIARW